MPKQMKPCSQVFHVSSFRNRESILEYGLLPGGLRYLEMTVEQKANGRVYVNNFPLPLSTLKLDMLAYPFAVYDYFEGGPYEYDFWLIETKNLDALWYADYLMYGDLTNNFEYNNKLGMHLWTNQIIPPSHLTLCEFTDERDYMYSVVEGVYHFRSLPVVKPVNYKQAG